MLDFGPIGDQVTLIFKKPFFNKYDEFKLRVTGHAKKRENGDWEIPVQIISPIEVRKVELDEEWHETPYSIFSGGITHTYKDNILIKQIINPKYDN